MEASTLVEILVASSFFTAIGETLRWWRTRGSARIDNAKAVQNMALELLKPLREELQYQQKEMSQMREGLASARTSVQMLQAQLEAVIVWAIAARSILEENNLPYPTVPAPLKNR